MSVSVILVAYHSDKWLPTCIDSLAEASASRLHLVLVDNAGNTLIDDLDLSPFDAEVIQTPRPMGFAEANNYALSHASHLEQVVLFLNQDTVSRSAWIDACLDCFAQKETLGAVSPLIRTYEFRDWDPSFLACVDAEELSERPGATEERPAWFQAKNAPAPALLVRTAVLRRTGPFDPVFGSYYEDYDLCRRIRLLGFVIGFCRSAEIGHYSGSTTDTREKERRRMQLLVRNRLLYRLREAGGPRLWGLLKHFAISFPRNLARGVVGTPSSQPPSVTLKAHADLLRLGGRLVSRRLDEQAWQAYLDEIGWVREVASQPSSYALS